jgi:hypothetical protein
MRWCLQVKLIQNWDKFSKLLLETGDLPIVEDSRKDDFWGAKPVNEEILTGANVLGRLLMQVREQIKSGELTSETVVQPLPIQDFLLYRQEIGPVIARDRYYAGSYEQSLELIKRDAQPSEDVDILNISEHELEHDEGIKLNQKLEEKIIEIAELKFDKYDSLQFVLPHLVEKLQESEHSDKELAKLFKTNLKQMHDWLERAVKLGKVKKLSKPVRYVAESQLSLIS